MTMGARKLTSPMQMKRRDVRATIASETTGTLLAPLCKITGYEVIRRGVEMAALSITDR